MQVQSSQQTLFGFLILGKSRFPPKKFLTSTLGLKFVLVFQVWNATTGKCLKTLVGHTGGVWSSQMEGERGFYRVPINSLNPLDKVESLAIQITSPFNKRIGFFERQSF